MLVDFLLFTLIFFIIGFLPAFLISDLIKSIDTKAKIIFSLGFAPVLISIYNIINVLLNLEHSFMIYAIPVSIDIAVIIFSVLKRKTKTIEPSTNSRNLPGIITGFIFGISYWIISFYNCYKQGVLYPDITYNLGLVSELKLHFPPVDPHWFSGQFLSYHYLTDLFIASISNFTRLDIIHSMHCMNLFTSISIFILLSLFIENKHIERLIVFLATVFISFCYIWPPIDSFYSHITGVSASTFFWSLPIFITSLYLWEYLNNNRFQIPLKYFSIIVLLYLTFVFFAKGTLILVFVILEFLAFIKNELFSVRKYSKQYKLFIKNTLYYLSYPLVCFLLIYLFGDISNTLVLGIEVRDFEIFGSWNPLYPLLAIYGITILVLLIEIRNLKKFKINFLICSILNFLLFLIYKHPGYSDLYFLFNAILLNSLFLIFSGMESPLKSVFISIIIINLVVFVFDIKKENRNFNTLEFNLNNITRERTWGDSIYSRKISELIEISHKLPDNSLIVVPKNPNPRFFCYSAFLGRRIWNENNLYKFNTNSVYSLRLLFQKQESFIPEYITDKPNIDDYQKAFDAFSKEIQIDSFKYEISEKRYQLYNKCVFDSLPENSYIDMVERNKWTHILVENSDSGRINYWIRNLNYIKGNYITIYTCP